MIEKDNSKLRTYLIDDACVFKKNDGPFGGLSNMSSTFALKVNGLAISSSEALYQALKFPLQPSLQLQILKERSPYKAKGIARQGTERADWKGIRVQVMRWCLRVKLAQNYHSFGTLLKSTGKLDIVEYSSTDSFWGADKAEPGMLCGQNALGRLLMELREFYLHNPIELCTAVPAPSLISLSLLGKPVSDIDALAKYKR